MEIKETITTKEGLLEYLSRCAYSDTIETLNGIYASNNVAPFLDELFTILESYDSVTRCQVNDIIRFNLADKYNI